MTTERGRILFYGIGSSYVYEMFEVALRAKVTVVAFVENMDPPGHFPGLHPLVESRKCGDDIKRVPAIIPLITPGYRKDVAIEMGKLGFSEAGVLLDPTAVIASTAQFDDGFQVNAGVVIGARTKFGKQVLVNRSASIGHDVEAKDFVSFGPGCVICGSCYVDTGVFVGAGATIAPGVNVGRNSVIGAGAVVVKNVPANTFVAGNPANVIREGVPGYNNTGV